MCVHRPESVRLWGPIPLWECTVIESGWSRAHQHVKGSSPSRGLEGGSGDKMPPTGALRSGWWEWPQFAALTTGMIVSKSAVWGLFHLLKSVLSDPTQSHVSLGYTEAHAAEARGDGWKQPIPPVLSCSGPIFFGLTHPGHSLQRCPLLLASLGTMQAWMCVCVECMSRTICFWCVCVCVAIKWEVWRC